MPLQNGEVTILKNISVQTDNTIQTFVKNHIENTYLLIDVAVSRRGEHTFEVKTKTLRDKVNV